MCVCTSGELTSALIRVWSCDVVSGWAVEEDLLGLEIGDVITGGLTGVLIGVAAAVAARAALKEACVGVLDGEFCGELSSNFLLVLLRPTGEK